MLDPHTAQRAASLLSHDDTARHASRFYAGQFELLQEGARVATITIDHGDIHLAEASAPHPTVRIHGSSDQWGVILGGLHGGLHRAWRYRLLDFEGDAVTMMQLWKVMWRLGDALVQAHKEVKRGGAT